MRKSALLLTLAAFAVIIDGTLSISALQPKIGAFTAWAVSLMIVGVAGAVYWAEKGGKRDN
ncbi:MAG: hypothetical protein ACE5GQ_03135 [Nitrospinales bacterium]